MFDIDIISLSIAVILIAAFILPLYLHISKAKKRETRATKLLEDFAKSQGLEIQVKDLWRSRYFVGLDRNKAKLLYSDDIALSSPVLIDLYTISRVKIGEVSHKVVNQVESRKVIDRLDLILLDKNGDTANVLEFYDGNRFSDLNGETILIKKWETYLEDITRKILKDQLVL
ncbi:hypothetical protein [Negadavirga shengliensis]|uniref:Uncharacterized protein n=1 Tax=Negadavirga shengliensis TaxID=1389218 RepID=A0ABV9T310_9BACT